MVFQGEGAPSTGTGHGGWERKVTFMEPVLEAGVLSQTLHMLYFLWFSECLYQHGSDDSHYTDEEAPTAYKQWGCFKPMAICRSRPGP